MLVVLFAVSAAFIASVCSWLVDMRFVLSRDSLSGNVIATYFAAIMIVVGFNTPAVKNASLNTQGSGGTSEIFADLFLATAPLENVELAHSASETADPNIQNVKQGPAAPTMLMRLRTIEDQLRGKAFVEALSEYRSLTQDRGELGERHKDRLEAVAVSQIRPLPASDRAGNFEGYRFLRAVRPDNPDYLAKLRVYR